MVKGSDEPDRSCPDSELTPEERRMRATQYRQLAAGIVSGDIRNLLLRLATRHESLAAKEPGGDYTASPTADRLVALSH